MTTWDVLRMTCVAIITPKHTFSFCYTLKSPHPCQPRTHGDAHVTPPHKISMWSFVTPKGQRVSSLWWGRSKSPSLLSLGRCWLWAFLKPVGA